MVSRSNLMFSGTRKMFCLLVVFVFFVLTSNLFACRLFMMVSKDGNQLNSEEVESLLMSFKAQATSNPNGWGIVAFDKYGVPIPGFKKDNCTKIYDPLRFSSDQQANLDSDFDVAITTINNSSPYLIMAHLRKATSGNSGIPDPHPFVYQNSAGRYYAFAHNGSVPPCATPSNSTTVKSTMNTFVNNNCGSNFGTSMTDWNQNIDSSIYFRYILAQLSLNEWKMGKVTEILLNNPNDIFDTNWAGNFIMSDGKQGFALRRKAIGVVGNPYDLYTNAKNGVSKYYLVLTENLATPIANMELMQNEISGNAFPSLEYLAPANFYCQYYAISNLTPIINKKVFERNCYFPSNLPPSSRDYISWLSYPIRNTFLALPGSPIRIQGAIGEPAVYNSLNDSWERRDVPFSPLQIDGYKATIKNSNSVTTNPNYSNFQYALPTGTAEYLTISQSGPNWIGYWLLNNQTLKEALGTHFGSVRRVYSERWAYDSENILTSSNCNQMMQFGKMYIIELKPSVSDIVSFTWANSQSSGNPASLIQQATQYSFLYQPEYEVLNIESLDSKTGAEEIGVFANNDCIGAAKIDQFPVQILLYSKGYEGYPLSFEVIDASKNRSNTYRALLLNKEKKPLETQLFAGSLDFSNIKLIQLNDSELIKSEIQDLQNIGNFPNPANPTTTIRFSINQAQQVSVEIYNLKGQKVKKLVNQYLVKGTHAFVWDGQNEQNNTVSSGIYMYKIKTSNQSISRKLMFIK